MLEYREKATTNDDDVEEPYISDNRAYSGDAYMQLAAEYGLDDDDDMVISNPGNNRHRQTVEEEYQAYVTAPCSSKDVTSLKFWEVSGDINDVNLLTRRGRSTSRCFQRYSRWQWTISPSKPHQFHASACFRQARKRIQSGGIASTTSQRKRFKWSNFI